MIRFPIPDAALASHIAVLGKTGSGKTTTSKGIIEHVVPEGYRVCILDPIKSDWWGITSSADGKRAGLPFTILGGPRGHVPLHATSGKVLADLVGKGTLPHSILDMANFKPGEHQRFFTDFAEALMKKNRGVLYLVLEEAHFFAPKERAGISGENMAVYWAKMLATAGRAKGIRLLLLTQRTQALHNALLGSCETMIVHRLTAPADQDPVQKWLKANVSDKELIRRIDAEMSSLPTGSAWLCSGEAKVFDLVKFPRIKTFDNSATPEKDGNAIDVKTAPVDQEKLRAIIGDAVAEADANDPAKLKARIAELEHQRSHAVAEVTPSVQLLEESYNRGHQDGYAEGRVVGRFDGITEMGPTVDELRRIADGIEARQAGAQAALGATPQNATARRAKPIAAPPRRTNGAAAPVKGDLRDKILEAFAFWAANGITTPSRIQVGFAAGYKAQAGVFRGALNAMREAGEINYEGDVLSLTPEGRAAAPRVDAGPVWDRLSPKLSDLQRRIVEVLPSNGAARDRSDIGQAIGMSPQAGVFRGALNDLKDMGVITYDKGEPVSVEPWVFA